MTESRAKADAAAPTELPSRRGIPPKAQLSGAGSRGSGLCDPAFGPDPVHGGRRRRRCARTQLRTGPAPEDMKSHGLRGIGFPATKGRGRTDNPHAHPGPSLAPGEGSAFAQRVHRYNRGEHEFLRPDDPRDQRGRKADARDNGSEPENSQHERGWRNGVGKPLIPGSPSRTARRAMYGYPTNSKDQIALSRR